MDQQSKPAQKPKKKSMTVEEEELGEHRLFTRHQKEVCWNNAKPMLGRDPERWRYDPVGNPVLKALRGCQGSLCHEYDHIVPFSKGGKTVLSNCQILQTGVNRFKSNKMEVPIDEMHNSSRKLVLTPYEMDLIEYTVYGDYGPDGAKKRKDIINARKNRKKSPAAAASSSK